MNERQPKAFITGGTGFIGRAIVQKLIARSYKVTALTRTGEGASALRAMGAKVVLGDVTDRESMREGMRGSDVVFHTASASDFTRRELARCESVNVDGTRNVLGLAHELDIPRIIYTSTVAVFGNNSAALPDENFFVVGPFLSDYVRTKWLAHYEVAEPLIAQGAPIMIVAPGKAYGPGDTSWLAQTMRQFYRGHLPILSAPETTLCYTHVDDIAEGHILAAEKGLPGESYILAGPAVPLGEMVEFWAQLTGKRPPLFSIPSRFTLRLVPLLERIGMIISLPDVFKSVLFQLHGVHYTGRSNKARLDLGWRTRPLHSGMSDTFEWIAATESSDAGRQGRWPAALILSATAGYLFYRLLRRKRLD